MNFKYVIKTKQGETQAGIVEAVSRRSAIETLQSKGFIILNLDEEVQKPLFSRDIEFFNRVKQKELVIFARQLSILVSAQVPLLASLQSLAKQTDRKFFQGIILDIANDVEGGMVFSRALSRYPKVFSNFFVNMVRSGEASGSLESSLLYLADYLEKQHYLTTRIRNALSYPAFISAAFVIIGVLMMVVVVPRLTTFLQESGVELPVLTRILIGFSYFLKDWWWVIFLLVAGTAGYLIRLIRTSPRARRQWDEMKLRMPILGKKIFQKIYVARIAENLSTLIQGGLSILQALQVTGEVVGNVVFQEIIIKAKEDVRVGNTLSSSLAKHKEIPVLVSQMVATGEQTGSLDSILKKMSQFYSREIDSTVETLPTLIEPILLLVIAGGVAVLMMAVLMPIYNIANMM